MTCYRNFLITGILLSLSLLSSCFISNEEVLPPGTGKPGELVVVMDSTLWATTAGESAISCFSAPQDGLPQDEPWFNVIRVRTKEFKRIFRTTRNIVMIDIAPESKKSKFAHNNNMWARDQLVLTILAKDENSIKRLLSKNCEALRREFQIEEAQRLQKAYALLNNESVASIIEEQTGASPSIPSDYSIAEQSGTVWIRKDVTHQGHQINMGLLFSTMRYNSEDKLNTDTIVLAIDKIVRKVSGPVAGSYMKVYKEYVPVSRDLNVNGRYVKELRGLWNMKGAFMGGPFVYYAFIDQKSNKVITILGYVFAPKFDKREYLRELEAIALSAVD